MWCSCEPPHFLYRIFWPASVTLSYPLAKWHPISQDTFALLQLKRRSSSDTWAYEAEVQNFEKSLRGTLTADAEGYIHVEWSAAIFFFFTREMLMVLRIEFVYIDLSCVQKIPFKIQGKKKIPSISKIKNLLLDPPYRQ